MKRVWKATVLAVVFAWTLSAIPGYGQGMDSESQRAILDEYCVGCHNAGAEAGLQTGLLLDELDVSAAGDNSEAWEKVVRKVRAGMMPPTANRGARRPDDATLESFIVGLEAELDRAAAARPPRIIPPGAHRMNRTEYQNAIRDLTDLEIDAAAMLPVDDTVAGFDNVASALGMSAALMEAYVSAAEKVSRLAMGSETIYTETGYRTKGDASQTDRVEGLAFGTRGGMLVRHNFPVDGEYDIVFQPVRDNVGRIVGGPSGEQFEITIDGERVRLWNFDTELLTSTQTVDGDSNAVRVFVKAGMHEVGAAFLARRYAPTTDYLRLWANTSLAGESLDFYTQFPHVSQIQIIGPFNPMGVADSASRRKILTCAPTSASEELDCAEEIISNLANRAFRRPSNDEDMEALLGFYQEGREDGDFDTGIELALQRILSDPEFVYRTEIDPPNVAPGETYAVTDLELASRLSFFLWSSVPDDELIQVATEGRLSNPDVLEQQVRRLLADDQAESLSTNFAAQWLNLRALPGGKAALVYPDFDDTLRSALATETEMFFDSIVREDRSVLDLMTADYTFLNERLARHYGIPGVYGPEFQRVTLGEEFDVRRGLLGKGSILLTTSDAARTAPVIRGKWVLMNILGTLPPEPPPNVPLLEEQVENGQVVQSSQSMRTRMEQHRANPVCASCHRIMDPIGFGLENFDGIGMWRTREGDEAVNASATFVDGTPFNGPSELREVLMKYSEQFARTLTEKLLIFAVGRNVDYEDMPAIRSIVRDAADQDYSFSSIVMGIVNSDQFRLNTKMEQTGQVALRD